MLGHKTIPSRKGGVEIVVGEIATRMADKGHKVVCYNRNEKDEEKLNTYKGVKLKRVFTVNLRGAAAMSSSFFAAIRAAFGGYDVVHFHAEGPSAMCFIPKLFGKRIVVTIHGLDWQRDKWGGFATKYIFFGEKMAVKFADEIIVLSENVKKYFKDTYNRETVFIPNGISKPEKIEADLIKKWGLEKDSYILYLGRIVPEKGVSYLIDAYSKIECKKKLVIAGGSSDTSSFFEGLKEKAKDNKNIIFTDFVQGKALEELYSNAYIYTLPSDLEGMPISLLEAMSYGNCCLVSNISECTEAVCDKAVHFKKSDVDDLADKLKMLCDNEDMVEKYRSEASDYICNRFNWDDIVEETLKLYKK